MAFRGSGAEVKLTSCMTSDLHLPGAAEAVLGFAASLHAREPLAEVVLVGDRTIEPDLSLTEGHNLLREAKEQARAAGLSVAAEEEKLWQGPLGPVLVRQWLEAVERTEQLHRFVEGLVRRGALPRIVDTGGNDADKERRVVRAAQLSGRTGLSLLGVLERSFAFRPICGVEQRLAGGTLTLDIPYLAEEASLERWQRRVSAILAAHIGLSAIILRGHLNSDPALRQEPRCAWYQEPFAQARRLHPRAELIHVCGHSHRLSAPYRFGEVLVVPVGYGKETATQRLFVMDYLDRSGWRLLDFEISSGRLVNDEPLASA
jgi:hypothetical protein